MLADGTVGALGLGLGAAAVRHFRKHGPDKPPERSTLDYRIEQANRQGREDAEHDPDDTGSGGINPFTTSERAWGTVHGPHALQAGGKGNQPTWLDLTAAPGIGLCGPGAFGVMRCCWLAILLRIGQKPPGRIIIPVTDAIRLFGTARPNTVPEGLQIVDHLQEAIAALRVEFEQRAAAPDQVRQMPLVVLMLAEAPADPDDARELATLLRSGRHLGVAALIGDDWPDGVTIEVDRRSVVTDVTGGPSVLNLTHLRDAFLFHLSAKHVIEECDRIDTSNHAAAHRRASHPAGASTSNAATTITAARVGVGADTTAGDETTADEAMAGPRTEPIPARPAAAPHPMPAGPDNSASPDTAPGQLTPDQPAGPSPRGAAEHTQPPAPDIEPDGSAIDSARTASQPELETQPETEAESESEPEAASPPPPDTPAPDTPATPATATPTTRATAPTSAAADDAPAGRSDTPTSPEPRGGQHSEHGEPAAPARESSSWRVRLEFMHTPRILLIPDNDGPDDPNQTPRNITPRRGKAPMHLLVNLGLHREGQRRAAAAAELWPDTNIERPTNTFNSYRTRIRSFIQDTTGGAITELIQDNEDGTCQLRPDLFEVDYWEFLDAIDKHNITPAPERAQAYLEALENYRGQLAENIDTEWITEYRTSTHTAALQAAVDLAHDLTDNHDDPDTAILVLDGAIALEPSNEPMYQHVIPLLVNSGRRDAAVQRYKALEKVIHDLGLGDPLPETRRLLDP